MASEYWKDYWRNKHEVNSESLQIQVARTRSGNPIAEENWRRTLLYVSNLLQLQKNEVFLDACGGNGLFASNLHDMCNKTIVVDVNGELLTNLTKNFPEITAVNSDLIHFLDENEQKFDKILFYAGIQYFSEIEVYRILSKYMEFLNPEGVILIGDIPDLLRRDSFLSGEFRYKGYFENLRNGKETIGTWFSYEWLKELANYLGFESCELHHQPEYQIYSDFRFDVVIRKH